MIQLKRADFKATSCSYIEPAFSSGAIVVVFQISPYYVPYFSVCLESLLANTTNDNNYDLIVLSSGLQDYQEKRLNYLVSNKPNISLRFFDPTCVVEKFIKNSRYQYLYLNYYKLALPWILSKYDKFISLGADLLLNTDIALLFEQSFDSSQLIGGVQDLGYLGRLNIDIPPEELNLKNKNEYINADVLMFSADKIREEFELEDVMSVWQRKQLRCAERDALNLIFDGRKKLFELAWNYFPDRMNSEIHISFAPSSLREARERIKKTPSIIHFAAVPKPWDDPLIEFADVWWNYARKGIWYEELLLRARTIRFAGANATVTRGRMLCDSLFPKGSSSREFLKKMFPRNSQSWKFFKYVQRKLKFDK